MEIKIFGGTDIFELEREANEFIKDKKVVDIKVSQSSVETYTKQKPAITLVVLYEDEQ